MKQRTSLPVLSTDEPSFSNSPPCQSASNINSSTSIRVSNSCSNHIFPSRLSLKKLNPEPWQRLFDGKKQQKLTIKPNTRNVDTMLNEDYISLLNEHSVDDNNFHCSFLPPPIQTHIDRLHKQINNLTLQLSEQRLEHKQTRIEAGKRLSNQLQDREKQYHSLLEYKVLDHEHELKEQEKKYFKLLNEERMRSLQREEQLRNELNFVKISFHAYKINLDKENAEKHQIKIPKVLTVIKEEEMDKRINDILMQERRPIAESENTRKEIKIRKSNNYRPRFVKKNKKH